MLNSRFLASLALLALPACGGQANCPDCPEPKCPPCDCEKAGQTGAPTTAAATGGSTTLEDWEAGILQPYLEELRAGIQLADEEAFGVCTGRRKCEQYLGAELGEPLPPGEYHVKAWLLVPSLGEPWQVRFHVRCTQDDGHGNRSTSEHEKTYTVKYAGKGRPYHLEPLWRIQSPHPNGARTCDYTLTPIRPDGQEGQPWTGSYSTPAP